MVWLQLIISAYPSLPKCVRDSFRLRLPVIFPPDRKSDMDSFIELDQDPVYYILERIYPFYETV